jgi:hypothetical protein
MPIDKRQRGLIVNPSHPPHLRLTPRIASSLSSVRRDTLAGEVERGIVREGGTYAASMLRNPPPPAPPTDPDRDMVRGTWIPAYKTGASSPRRAQAVIAHSDSFRKQATAVGTVSGMSSATSAGSGVERLAPEVYSPLFTMANLNLPRDRITVNAWCRNFFDLHPLVRNAITLHATYPISKINIKCEDKRVEAFFEDMIEEMDLLGALGEISLEYWKLGEAFPYAELDERTMKWRRIIVQNPDYVHVKKTVVASEPVISLRPDAVLQRLVTSSNPADVQLRKQIPEPILFHVRRGENIPLDNFNVSHLKLLSSPYDVRGTSVIVSVFKDLMLYDKLREAKFAQADGLVNPITLVKVGGTGEGEYHPTPEDLEEWRHVIEEAQYDKDFKIITHHGITIERVGASGSVLDIAGDMELIIKNIHHGLMVPQAIIDTESAVYASASIGLEVLRQRYFNFRNMLAKWLMNKIFAPISDLQGFYKLEGGMKKLIVPEVEWNHMNLYDLQDYISSISSLVTTKQVSLQTLYRSLGLNYEDERKKLRHEMVNDTIRAREEAALAGMDLTELRSIDPEQEIMPPVPAEGAPGAPPGGMPGMPPGGEMGGAPMGGMPPMPGGGGGGLPGGLPELAPPPGEALGPPGAGAPGGGGVTPPLGPGTPGGPPGGGGGAGGPGGGV